MKEPTLLDIVVVALVFYGLWAVCFMLRRLWNRFRAAQHLRRYNANRHATFASKPTENRDSRDYTAQYILEQEFKDKDARVQDMAQPKGFWTKLIMGEKMGLIREMIRIANSAQHKGYWQDRVEAQKRVETGRSIGEDGQGR